MKAWLVGGLIGLVICIIHTLNSIIKFFLYLGFGGDISGGDISDIIFYFIVYFFN